MMCAFVPGVQGTLTTTPQNVLVLKGQDAVLNCSTNSTPANGQNPITWNYDGNILSFPPCSTSSNPGFIASPNDSATECNMRALGSYEHGISGAYRCIDGDIPVAVAMVIVLGQ